MLYKWQIKPFYKDYHLNNIMKHRQINAILRNNSQKLENIEKMIIDLNKYTQNQLR